MFEKIILALILVLAAILVFSGCSDMENKAEHLEDEIESRLDPIEDAMESKADAVEDAIEDALIGNATEAVPTNEAEVQTDAIEQDSTAPAEPESATNPAQESIDKVAGLLGDILKEQASGVTVPDSVLDGAASSSYEQSVFITPEAAQQLALDHAGVAAADAVFDRTERDYDNGIYHYEVEFHIGYTEYEYDIHAENGSVLSFEID